jgi:hypothetical protein
VPSFTEHQQEIARRGSVDLTGEAQSSIKDAINNSYKRVLAETFQDMRQRIFTVVTTASQATLGLPLEVRTILDIQDTANRISLGEMSVEEFDKLDPGRTVTGTPREYFQIGRFGIIRPLAATGVVSIESSAAADSLNLFVRLTGYDANGVRSSENITLNGTTAVNSTTSYDPSESRGIERITKYNASARVFAGTIIAKDASGNVIARIPIAYDSPTYTWVEFDQIPSAALTYQVRAMVTKPLLLNDNDWPEFDDQYHDILTLLGSGEVLPLFGKQTLATQYLKQGNERLQEFKDSLDMKPNITYVLDNVQMGGPRGRLGQPILGIDFGRVA